MRQEESPLSDYVREAYRVVEYGKQKGVILRVMGAAALRIHCPKYSSLHQALGRELTDLDFAGYESQSDRVEKAFVDLGYEAKQYLSAMMERGLRYRKFFYDARNKRMADVFLDKLAMCHEIVFQERLEIDYPTLSLADLLLTKMQIVKLTEKDVKDSTILLLEHDVGSDDKDTINSDYISKLLSDDWGFYYTVIANLEKIGQRVDMFPQISDVEKQRVKQNVDFLLIAINERPKSFRWKMRARIGTKKQWYNDVEEVVR